MIVYGYKLNLNKIPKKLIKEFESLKDVTLETGYSVSTYEPEDCVLGIVLDRTSFLFNPVCIKNLVTKPSEEQKNLLQKSLSEKAKLFLIKKKAKTYIFEDSDD